MAVILFQLAGVGDDEANDVRQLLDDHDFDCYETDGGRWRIGVQAIWLRDDARYGEARALIDEYQFQRREQQVSQWQEQAPRTLVHGLWQRMWERPLTFVMTLLSLLIVLGVSLMPFLSFF
jgi:hypothetical protein